MKLTQGQISEMISDLTKSKESFSLLMSEILNSLMKRERSLWQEGSLESTMATVPDAGALAIWNSPLRFPGAVRGTFIRCF